MKLGRKDDLMRRQQQQIPSDIPRICFVYGRRSTTRITRTLLYRVYLVPPGIGYNMLGSNSERTATTRAAVYSGRSSSSSSSSSSKFRDPEKNYQKNKVLPFLLLFLGVINNKSTSNQCERPAVWVWNHAVTVPYDDSLHSDDILPPIACSGSVAVIVTHFLSSISPAQVTTWFLRVTYVQRGGR